MKLRYLIPVLMVVAGGVFVTRAPLETDGAAPAAQTSPGSSLSGSIVPRDVVSLESEVADVAAQTPEDSLLALHKILGDSSDRTERLGQWAAKVPRESIRSTLKQVALIPDPRFRSEALYALFAKWAAEDPENAVLLLRQYAASGQLP